MKKHYLLIVSLMLLSLIGKGQGAIPKGWTFWISGCLSDSSVLNWRYVYAGVGMVKVQSEDSIYIYWIDSAKHHVLWIDYHLDRIPPIKYDLDYKLNRK